MQWWSSSGAAQLGVSRRRSKTPPSVGVKVVPIKARGEKADDEIEKIDPGVKLNKGTVRVSMTICVHAPTPVVAPCLLVRKLLLRNCIAPMVFNTTVCVLALMVCTYT